MAKYEFKLPDVGEGVHEGEIVKWLVKVGDKVANDQPLVEVQTDKALVELPSPVAGTIVELNGAEGEIVNVGTVIVVIETEAGATAPPAAPAAAPAPQAAPPAAAAAPAPAAGAAPAAPARPAGERALAAPTTRRLARELGIDINLVPGTGPGGRVTAEDVRAFAAGGAPAAAPTPSQAAQTAAATPAATRPAAVAGSEERVPLRGLRRKIAEKMVQSKFTAPHVTCMDEVDVTELKSVRAQANEMLAGQGKKLTYMPFIIKAVVGALKQFPTLNSSLDEEAGELVVKHYYNIGVATATPEGLMVPVIHNADQLSLLQLGDEVSLLAEQARSRRIDLSRLQGGTFTISNIGNIGGLFATPVINYPEVAILGINRIQARPVVRDGEIVVRDMMYVNLSFDHRVIDGDVAVMFLQKVIGYLENPNLMFMELI